MSRPILVLLLLVPLAIFGEALGIPHAILFFIALGAVVPLAAVISAATEQAALAKGPRIGGLLNATFGNVPDLLVGYYGVRSGLLPFVKATLIGGIISNTGLVIGLAFLVAGLRYGFPRFDSREAGRHTVLLLLAISGPLLPTLLAAAAALAPVTNVLVDTVTPTVQTLGWTDTFVGIVLVANAGNAAEMYAAIAMARKGRLDLLLGVASGSSIQIATFV
jgi:Ca2+:H+ antiporter